MLMQGGCVPILALHGAQPVPKKQVDLQLAAVPQSNTGPYAAEGKPLVVLGARVGLGGDMDLGVRLFALGGGFDFRYRFFEKNRFHLASTPGVDVAWDGDSDTLFTDFRVPLTAEWAASKNVSLIVDGRLILREFWLIDKHPWGPGSFNRTEVFLGGGARFEFHPKRFRTGFGLQVFHQPADGGKPAVVVGIDLGMRLGPHPK